MKSGDLYNYCLSSRIRQCLLIIAVTLTVLLAGCHQDMWNQPRNTANTASTFFSDGSAARPQVPGTVQYDGVRRPWASPVFARLSDEVHVPVITEDEFWTGRLDSGEYVPDNYFQVDAALLARGQDRFNINCAVCHGLTGDGKGIVVDRGFPEPPSYHIDRLREVEDGYIYDVITNGFGRMYAQSYNVTPEDRWAIAAYIRALQYSQNARMEDLTPDELELVYQSENPLDDDDMAVDNVH